MERQPPLKKVLKPCLRATRAKPQVCHGTTERSSRRAYPRERRGTSRGRRRKKRAWSSAEKLAFAQYPATEKLRIRARRASA